MHKTYVLDDKNPEHRKDWVLQAKHKFFIQVNSCVNSGATQIITDLPLSEQEVKALLSKVN